MHLETLHTEYLRASRTIDTIALSDEQGIQQLMYVYNYEGYSYRIFPDLSELLAFFEDGKEPELHFGSEEEIEKWWNKYQNGTKQ